MSTVTTTKNRRSKHLVLDQALLTKAKKISGARTETETVTRGLEMLITETERNRLAWQAHDEFIRAGIDRGLVIEDVYGRLDKN